MAEDKARTSTVPLFEETMRVNKAVREDKVLVRTSVRERVEYANLERRAEEAAIERIAINRVVPVAPSVREEGDTIIVPVVEEIMVVEKRLLLKEEIRIRRQEVVEHIRQPVRLRSEEASIEWLPSLDQNIEPKEE